MKKFLSIIISLFHFYPFNISTASCKNDEMLNKHCSLNTVVQELDFYKDGQKNAFKKLCNKAGIELPSDFTVRSLLELVVKTQAVFTNRKDKQERWEIIPLDWMKNDVEQNLQNVKILGFTDEILPRDKKYGAICILGAVYSVMKDRVQFAENLVNNGLEVSKIFLLSGERYITNVGKNGEEVLKICKKLNLSKEKLTEAHLMQYIFDNSSLSENYESILINTPICNDSRPTTKTTVQDFCKWVKENDFNDNVLFISSQPNILYQKSVISQVLTDEELEFKFDVVGPKTESRNIQTLVGALGSHIWAAMPQIIKKLGFKIESPEEVEIFESIYGYKK